MRIFYDAIEVAGTGKQAEFIIEDNAAKDLKERDSFYVNGHLCMMQCFGVQNRVNHTSVIAHVFLRKKDVPEMLKDFLLDITDLTAYRVTITVKEVTGWLSDDVVHEHLPYCKFFAKWDDDIYLSFGDGGGYYHIGGRYSLQEHTALMQFLYNFAGDLMGRPDWNRWPTEESANRRLVDACAGLRKKMLLRQARTKELQALASKTRKEGKRQKVPEHLRTTVINMEDEIAEIMGALEEVERRSSGT